MLSLSNSPQWLLLLTHCHCLMWHSGPAHWSSHLIRSDILCLPVRSPWSENTLILCHTLFFILLFPFVDYPNHTKCHLWGKAKLNPYIVQWVLFELPTRRCLHSLFCTRLYLYLHFKLPALLVLRHPALFSLPVFWREALSLSPQNILHST